MHRFRAGKVAEVPGIPISARSKLIFIRPVADCARLGGRLDWYDLSRALAADGESAPEDARRRLNKE